MKQKNTFSTSYLRTVLFLGIALLFSTATIQAKSNAAAPLSATQSQVNLTCNSVCNGSATVVASGGTAPYSYSWSPSGGSGATASSLCAGNYTCTITDAALASITKTFTISQPSTIIATPGTTTNVTCNGGSNGAASINTATGGVGSFTYDWTPGTPTGDGTTSVTGLTPGAWTCTVTDGNGCTLIRNYTITQPPSISISQLSQTNLTCNGGSDGALAINTPTGGTAGYTYDWTPGTPTGDGTKSVTGLTAGIWTCTVTDSKGCTKAQNYIITQPAAITATLISQANASCLGDSNGSISINTPTGGTAGYTYDWTPGTPTGDGTTSVNGLAPGIWTCTMTDANGCTGAQSYTITQPSTVLTTTPASQTNLSCNGAATGAAAINTPTGGTAGYSYNWTPGNPTGDGTTSVTGLTAGAWTCTITDAGGCVITQNFTLTQPSAITTGSASKTNVSCNGGSNGAATIITPTGGTGGYTYDWTPGTPTGDGTTSVTGLTFGSWTCTITDGNSCTKTQSFSITQPTVLNATAASKTNVSCNGGSNGAASINTPTGGTTPYTYNWTPGNPTGDGTKSVTGLTAGVWTCTVTDGNGCTKALNITVTEPAAINTSVTESSGVFTATQTGATYQWKKCSDNSVVGTNANTFTPSDSSFYKVDITVGGCMATSNCITLSSLATTDFEKKPQFLIYPNPSSGVINIQTEKDSEYQIITPLGKIMKTFKANANSITTINVENLSNGVYFVKDVNQIKSYKLVIKK